MWPESDFRCKVCQHWRHDASPDPVGGLCLVEPVVIARHGDLPVCARFVAKRPTDVGNDDGA